MYTIIHIKKGWIVCDGQTKLIKFNRKSVALRTAHNAEKLLHANETAELKKRSRFPRANQLLPDDPVAIVESSFPGTAPLS
jgi:hypothetical protein